MEIIGCGMWKIVKQLACCYLSEIYDLQWIIQAKEVQHFIKFIYFINWANIHDLIM